MIAKKWAAAGAGLPSLPLLPSAQRPVATTNVERSTDGSCSGCITGDCSADIQTSAATKGR
jgi:hypothetical protein